MDPSNQRNSASIAEDTASSNLACAAAFCSAGWPYLDAIDSLLLRLDLMQVGRTSDSVSEYFHQIRAHVCTRVKASRSWHRLVREKSHTAEMHLASALNRLFFQNRTFVSAGTYFPADGNLVPFMPALNDLVTSAPRSGYVAEMFLRLIEAAPKASLLPYVILAAVAWHDGFGIDPDFWVEKRFGSRLCTWFANAKVLPFGDDTKALLLGVLDTMVKSGVSEAKDLE